MVYLPYAVTNNESGFMGGKPIKGLADLKGKRIRLSGRDQGRVLEELGGSQVTLAGGEVYQAIERGVIDAGEFNTPGVDQALGFGEVAKHWATPGWHQSASVFGVMINRDAWNKLSPDTQEKLKVAAEATMAWSFSWTERTSTEGAIKLQEQGVKIHQFSDQDLEKIQDITNEVIVRGACEDPMHAKIYHSMVSYMEHYANWRDLTAPFNMSRSIDNLPSLAAIEKCL
ncbi:TRAP transporter substrate-binding protein DctP [Marinobacter salexigens]|uniref:TRAP transporter substrate-binding protein DctP n=1 Tax=Marinobacter salexigens TaxID=1925763 RepID=UPI001961A378|nr:TRAP transporter substrate-binding protein DctP [Marinobacter salexigens]